MKINKLDIYLNIENQIRDKDNFIKNMLNDLMYNYKFKYIYLQS